MHQLFLCLTQPLYLQRAQASWKCKTEPRTDSSVQTCAVQLCLAPCYPSFAEGQPRPRTPRFLQHVRVAPAAPGCPWANPVAINLFSLSHKSTHSFLHGHNVIKHNPCPCSPGEVKAQSVWCFSHCSAHRHTGMVLGNAFQGKAGQIHLAVTPCKAC